ncbi:unnamed protein product, partial [Allacma fusca]
INLIKHGEVYHSSDISGLPGSRN